MADAIRCKHCGWSEFAHTIKGTVGASEMPKGKQRFSLAGCPGYEPKEQKVHRSRYIYIPPRGYLSVPR